MIIVFNWLWKRVFSDENVGFLIKKADPHVTNYVVTKVKEATFILMEDPEFHAWLTQMGDAYYDRYMKKINGWIGGKQKGINYAVNGAIENLNPLAGVMDEDGNFSLSMAIKTFMSGAFRGAGSPEPGSPGSQRALPPPM